MVMTRKVSLMLCGRFSNLQEYEVLLSSRSEKILGSDILQGQTLQILLVSFSWLEESNQS